MSEAAAGQPQADTPDAATAAAIAAAAAQLEADKAKGGAAPEAKGNEGAAPGLEFKAEPEAKPEEKTPEVEGEVQYEYNKTGDSGLDLALSFIGKLGFAADNPAVVDASKGDFKAIKSAMAALGDKAKGYEDYLKLAEESYGRIAAKAKARADETEAQVYAAVGGKETWAKVFAYVEKEADAGQKTEINAALKAGGLTAVAVARDLLSIYNRANGVVKSVVKADAAVAAAADTGTLTAAEYGKAVAELRRKTKGPVESSPEYARLSARYLAGRK